MSTYHISSSERPMATKFEQQTHLDELILLRLMELVLVKTSFKDHAILKKPYNVLSRRGVVTILSLKGINLAQTNLKAFDDVNVIGFISIIITITKFR